MLIKNSEFIQISLFTKTQVFHENLTEEKAKEKIIELMVKDFKQAEINTEDRIYFYKVTDKGKLLKNSKPSQNIIDVIPHNKEKNYLLKEGVVVPPLVDLGVMNSSGYVVKAYYDKYKQINRFLEIIEDTVGQEKKLNIIDFGCGKSYLTFILYYYLVEIKRMDVNIIGLDLKEEVIKHCNQIANKYGYNNLSFELGDISLYQPKSKVDMIITLHACDTATDYAMYHAIKLDVKYLFSVPCCQHELNKQMPKESLELINKYGILKDRFCAIMTDAIRANILELVGYRVNVMEFIDYENSPKNLLIKAVLTKNKNLKIKDKLEELVLKYQIKPTLYKLIVEDNR